MRLLTSIVFVFHTPLPPLHLLPLLPFMAFPTILSLFKRSVPQESVQVPQKIRTLEWTVEDDEEWTNIIPVQRRRVTLKDVEVRRKLLEIRQLRQQWEQRQQLPQTPQQ